MSFSRSLVVIGNPGSGKSTLINCMQQQRLFNSGVATKGAGVTQSLEVRIHNGVRFMDTPGLADVKLRQTAAKAIESVLKAGGLFQICFVMTLQRGRILADDLTTVKLVLNAANQITENRYSILINQVSEKVLAKLDRDAIKQEIDRVFSEGKLPTTNRVHYMRRIEELEDENDKIVSLDAGTMSFLTNMPTFHIQTARVKAVNSGGFDQMKRQHDEAARNMMILQRQAEQARAEREKAEAARRRAEEERRVAQEKAAQAAAAQAAARRRAEAERAAMRAKHEELRRAAEMRREQERRRRNEPVCVVS